MTLPPINLVIYYPDKQRLGKESCLHVEGADTPLLISFVCT